MNNDSLKEIIKEIIVKEFMAISLGAGTMIPSGQIAGGPALPLGMQNKIPSDIKVPAGRKKRRKKSSFNEANSVVGMNLATWGVDASEQLFGSNASTEADTEMYSDGDETNIPNNKNTKISKNKSNAHKINPSKDRLSSKKQDLSSDRDNKILKTSSQKALYIKSKNPFHQLMWSGDSKVPNTLKVKYIILEKTIKENNHLLDKSGNSQAIVNLDHNISDMTKDALTNFLQFCQGMLNIKDFPEIYILSERIPGMTTGAYLPNKKLVLALSENRLMIDVFRTIAHELTHCKQHERGELDNLPLRKDEDDMSDVNTPYENEAYMNSGNFSKAWARIYKNMTRDEIFSMTI